MLLLYIDPGTGSLILQILFASVFGTLFAIKLFWSKIKNWTLKAFGKDALKKDD